MNKDLLVESYDGNKLDLVEFENSYLKKNRPVVIKNHFRNLKPSEWKIDYLLEKVGSNTVSVRGNTNANSYKVCLWMFI